jgi:DNA-directed RNA polymerase specialized sigma24 family protein
MEKGMSFKPENYLGMAQKIAEKAAARRGGRAAGLHVEDMAQAGLLYLCRVAGKFDPARGKASCFAGARLAAGMRMYAHTVTAAKRGRGNQGLSLDEEWHGREERRCPVESEEFWREVKRVLTPPQFAAIEAVYLRGVRATDYGRDTGMGQNSVANHLSVARHRLARAARYDAKLAQVFGMEVAA